MKRQLEAPGGLVDPDSVTADVIPVDLEDTQEVTDDDGYPAMTPGATDPVSSAAAFDANNPPPEILADPAVQAVISSVAVDHGFAADVATDPATALLSTEDPDLTSEAAPTRTAASRTSASLVDEGVDSDEDDDDFSATSSRTRGFVSNSKATSTASPSGIDEDEDDDQSSGLKLSAKFGWATLATLGAAYFVAL